MPKHKFPSDDSKERQLFEPILQKIAEKDATFAKTRLASRRRDSSRPNSSKKSAEKSKRKTDRRDSDFHSLSESVTADFPIVVKSSFPHLNFRTNSIQIEIGSEKNLSFKKKELHESIDVASSRPRTRSASVTSVKSNVSSAKSISSHIKSIYSFESKPSMYQKLVIPFSGFTEEDVREIRGYSEPPPKEQSKQPVTLSSLSITTSNKRPLLKTYQSEKRKSSYERYIQESLENLSKQKNNTEDSSYNTVLAVKMLVERAVGFEEESSVNLLDDAGTKTETISKPFSDISSLDFADLMKPVKERDPLKQNREAFARLAHPETKFSDKLYQSISLQEMDLRRELDLVTEEHERMLIEYEEAERVYFAAKLHLHKVEIRRNYLITQIKNLEKDYYLPTKRRKSG